VRMKKKWKVDRKIVGRSRRRNNVDKPVVKFISVVICSDNVQKQDIFGLWVESRDTELHLREHLSRNIKQKKKIIIFHLSI